MSWYYGQMKAVQEAMICLIQQWNDLTFLLEREAKLLRSDFEISELLKKSHGPFSKSPAPPAPVNPVAAPLPPSRRKKKVLVDSSERVAYSLPEFAALFGKSRSWAYRQMWSHSIKVITQFGKPMVPASEVNRLKHSSHLFVADENL